MRERRRCCAACGGEVADCSETLSVDFPASGVAASIAIPAARCERCDHVHVDERSMERMPLAVGCELANGGVHTGEALRYMRRALGLRAADLARLLDLTPETISHWETGKARPNRAAFVALAAMIEDALDGRSTTRDRLMLLADGGAPPPILTVTVGRRSRARRSA